MNEDRDAPVPRLTAAASWRHIDLRLYEHALDLVATSKLPVRDVAD